MIDLLKETTLTLTEATKLVKVRRGRKVHVSTLYRWANKGRFGIKLEIVWGSGGALTTAEAMVRYQSAIDAERRSRKGQDARVSLPETVSAARRKAKEDLAELLRNSKARRKLVFCQA